MTIEDAQKTASKMNKIAIDIWDAKSKNDRDNMRADFNSCWKSLIDGGYKIISSKKFDPVRGHSIRSYRVRDDGSKEMVSIIDNRGDGYHIGDCTTRCISFCTGIDYSTIQKEQFRKLAEAKADGYRKMSWRSTSIWSSCLTSRGFCRLVLPRHVSRKVFIKTFSDCGIDEGIIATVSSNHIAAIDMKSKKILDTWNSAGGRILEIYVPTSQKEVWKRKLNAYLG